MIIDISLFKSSLEKQKFSNKSINSYITCIKHFYMFFKKYGTEVVTVELIEKHVNWLVKEKNISKSYQKQILISLQKYYELVLNKHIDLSSISPKQKDYQLPKCLCKFDIKSMIEKTVNIKHKLIICLLYSGGLRLSELINLAKNDIDIKLNNIHIINNKDKSERKVRLSSKLAELLPQYYKEYNPKYFVIEGRNGEAYSEKGVQKVIKMAAERAGIKTQVTPNCLRHCFATHLLENGTDIRYVQELLGHQSIKTTENYNHTSDILNSNIQSPLDLL